MTKGLFANQRETNLASTVALVEEVLPQIGHQLVASRTQEPHALHAWRIVQGTATTLVSLIARAEFTHIRVQSVVMTLDATTRDRPELFAQLLEHNAQLCGVAFAIDGDRVLLVAERSTLDLDRSEIRELIVRVASHADEHDEVLVARYGGKLGAPTQRAR